MKEPRIQFLNEKKLVGKSIQMSLSDNKTFELWQSFMPLKKNLKQIAGSNLYSIQIFDESLSFSDFNPQTKFLKWAAVEVADFDFIPNGLESYILQNGLYAVFIHKGLASDFNKTFQHIFQHWLPQSEYKLDNRPHFELLGKKYINNSPDSEEEVWIPIH